MRSLLVLMPLLAAATEPPALPPPIKAMLDAAIAGGNDAEVATIVKYARAADPAAGDAAAAIADVWRTQQAAVQHEKLATAGPFELWSGRAEVGGYLTTGNAETVGATGVVDVQREGVNWRHKVRLQADYQKSLGITSREHFLAAYEPNLKLNDRRYLYGAAQFESDRFFGYDQRYSLSAGAGYGVVRSPRVTLDLELGPAYRATGFTDGNQEASVAARGKVDLSWKISPGLTISQNAAAYVQQFNSTVSSNTALAAKLIGPLSAQLSYAIQYESMPPEGRKTTDTTSRAALVYSF